MNIPENSTSRYQTHTFFDTLVLCPLPNTSSSRQYFVINFGTLCEAHTYKSYNANLCRYISLNDRTGKSEYKLRVSFYFIKKNEKKVQPHTFFHLYHHHVFSLLYHSHHVIRIRCLYCHWGDPTPLRMSQQMNSLPYNTQKHENPFIFYIFFLCSFAALIIHHRFQFFRIFSLRASLLLLHL